MSLMKEETAGGMTDSMSSEGLSSWHVVDGSETISVPIDDGATETVVVAASASYDESASSAASSSRDGHLKSIKAQKWKERLAKKGKKEEDGDVDSVVDKDDDAREPSTQPSKAQKWKDRIAKKNKQKQQEEEKEELLTNTTSAAEAAKLVLESSSFSELTAKKRAEEAAKKAAKEHAERKKLEDEKEQLAKQEEQAKQMAVAIEQQTPLQDVVVQEQLEHASSDLPAEQENADSEAVVPDVEIIEENNPEHIKGTEGPNTVDMVPSKSDLTMDDDDEGNGAAPVQSLIVLLSGSSAQRSSQDVVWTKLKERGIVFDEVNGGEPKDLAALRDQLSAISGVQGEYPQFFVKDSDRITYREELDGDDRLETFAGTIQVLVVQNPVLDETSVVPDRVAARSVSFGHTTIDTWIDEYPIPPKPQHLSSRTVSTDSALIPNETFENEFEDPSEILRSRSMSRDSTAIPEESFENEFIEENVVSITEQRDLDLISRDTTLALDESFENEDDQDEGLQLDDNTSMPNETFENEYIESTSLAVSATTQDDGVVLSPKMAPLASQATTSSVVPDEFIEDDNDAKKAKETSTQDSSSNSFLHLHITVGVLAVAVVAGMWLSGVRQRGK